MNHHTHKYLNKQNNNLIYIRVIKKFLQIILMNKVKKKIMLILITIILINNYKNYIQKLNKIEITVI